jgi:hypothetical protein
MVVISEYYRKNEENSKLMTEETGYNNLGDMRLGSM